jgi:cytochrome c oxidase cbb3-type subunit 3
MRPCLILTAAILLLTACNRQETPRSSGAVASEAAIEALPGGDLAGGARSSLGSQIRNPFEGDPQAIASGKHLFVQMNCAGCHGYDLGGSMGPNLTDV